MIARPWGDLVFHVLAHVEATKHLAASVFDRAYVEFVARAVGPASQRTLGEDIQALGGILTTHEKLAEAQLLAWLFVSIERAEDTASRDLSQLEEDDVDAPEILPRLAAMGPAIEVLRCAAELEREAHASLPPCILHASTADALRDQARVAPILSRCDVTCVRSLRLRGRVLRRPKATRAEIWIGAPTDDPGPSVEHVAWQASHEATVLEVSEAAARAKVRLDHDTLEHAAVALLAERARDMGVAEAHAAWFAHFGSAPDPSRKGLRADVVGLLDACRLRAG
jgi:hypothetical protein